MSSERGGGITEFPPVPLYNTTVFLHSCVRVGVDLALEAATNTFGVRFERKKSNVEGGGSLREAEFRIHSVLLAGFAPQ